MYSTPVRGTASKDGKTSLNWWQYWIGHCWMTGWQSIGINFRIWCDLASSRYDGYALLTQDDPEEECRDWFWTSLNEDDVYPKEFLEHLMQMVEDVELGKVETYSMDEVMDRLKNLVDGVELDDEEPT